MTSLLDQTSFLTGGNAVFIAELYARYIEDPASVDASWETFFRELTDDGADLIRDFKGTAAARRDTQIIGATDPDAPAKKPAPKGAGGEISRQALTDTVRALMLIRNYRVRGHLLADLDPLGLAPRVPHPELDYHSFGFEDADLDREIFISGSLGRENATLREIVTQLHATYCGTIGL